MPHGSDPHEVARREKPRRSKRSASDEVAGSSPRHGDTGMWAALEAAAEGGWGTTTRFCLLLMARYGPNAAMAVIVLKAIEHVGHHFGLA
jgi:hypothetical protein